MTLRRITPRLRIAAAACLALTSSGACRDGTGPRGPRYSHPQGVVDATVPLAGRPFAVDIASTGSVYVSLLDHDAIIVGDLASRSFGPEVPVGVHPSQVRFDRTGSLAYVGNQDTPSVGVVDRLRGGQVSSFALNTSVLTLGISADGSRIYAATDFDGVYVLDAKTGAQVANIPAGPILTGIAFHPKSPWVFVAARDGGTVYQIDMTQNVVTRTFAVSGSPQNVAISPDGRELYATDVGYGRLLIWDIETGTQTAALTIGTGGYRHAFDVAPTRDGAQIYVSDLDGGQIVVIDRASRSVVRTIRTSGLPRYIVFSATGEEAVVANEAGWVDYIR